MNSLTSNENSNEGSKQLVDNTQLIRQRILKHPDVAAFIRENHLTESDFDRNFISFINYVERKEAGELVRLDWYNEWTVNLMFEVPKSKYEPKTPEEIFAKWTKESGFKPIPEGMPIYTRIIEWLQKPQGNLLLYGAPGTGKTFLAKLMAEELNIGDEFVFFLKTFELANVVRNQFATSDGPEKVANMIRSAKRAKFLILDDFGTESMKGEAASNTLQAAIYEIADYRFERGKSTIITSNIENVSGFGQIYQSKIIDRLIPKRYDSILDFSKIQSQRSA
jgi:hypothetical protein